MQGEMQVKVEPPPALVPFLSRRGSAAVKRILTLHKPEVKDANFAGLPVEDLKLYFTLTARAEAAQPTPDAEVARLVFEPQMVKIPAGKFLMGSTKEQAEQAIKAGLDKKYVEWELPQHTVDLSEYSIGKYPITNREYQAFVRDAKYKPPQGWDGEQFPAEKGSHPVVNVSWDDANVYCKWLSEKTGKPYHLPTEAEWEKAARGTDGLKYPWGNEFDETRANVNGQVGNTTEVGHYEKGRSPYGGYDMIGNVWEWTADWYQPYPGNTYTSDKFGEKVKVLRGNSWAGLGHFPPKIHNEVKAHYSRAGYRLFMSPAGLVNDVGFRCAKSAE